MMDRRGDAINGSTARPEGEEARRHAGSSGEASRRALANGPVGRDTTTPPAPTGEPIASPLLSITRATCKILIDAATLADDREKHIRHKCGDGCPGCKLNQELRTVQREIANAANAAVRMHWLCDAEVLGRVRAREGRPPKGAEWKEIAPERVVGLVSPSLPAGTKLLTSKGNLYTYPVMRSLAPSVSSNIVATLSRDVEKKWSKERWDILVRLVRSPPHFRCTLPIPIPAASVTLTHTEGNWYLLGFSLLAGRGNGWRIPVEARDDYMRRKLSQIFSGHAKIGALKLVEDRLRPGRWYVRIAYTVQVHALQAGEKRCVVHPGIVTFLYALGIDGKRKWHDGKDIESFLKQVQSRRRSYQGQYRVSNRKGHGRSRALIPIEKLQGAGERWRATKVQTLARRYAEWIRDQGYTLVYMPDFSGIRDGLPEHLEGGKAVWDRIQEWPYFAQQHALTACLEEMGISVEKVEARGSAMTCRKCGFSDKKNIVLAKRKFVCGSCGHTEFLDAHTSANLLARGLAGPCERGGDGENVGTARTAQTKGDRDASEADGNVGVTLGGRTARKPARKRARTQRNGEAGRNGQGDG